MLPHVPADTEAGPSTVCLRSHTQDKLALGELCSGEAAYFSGENVDRARDGKRADTTGLGKIEAQPAKRHKQSS